MEGCGLCDGGFIGDMTFCELGDVTGMFMGDVIPGGLPCTGVALGLVTGYD